MVFEEMFLAYCHKSSFEKQKMRFKTDIAKEIFSPLSEGMKKTKMPSDIIK